MRRRKVFLLIEVDTVLNTRELRKLDFLAFGKLPERRTIRLVWPDDCNGAMVTDCGGQIVQVQVNAARVAKAKTRR